MRRVAIAVALAFLVAPAAAGAATVHLGWHEVARTQNERGKPLVAFHVIALATSKNAWAIAAEITNRSRTTFRLRPAFALAEYSTKRYDKPDSVLPALFVRPPLPATLRPGQTWRGEFGGPGKPKVGRFVRVVFGTFLSRLPKPMGPTFSWITDHAYKAQRPSPLAI